jgi:hypothetical protein
VTRRLTITNGDSAAGALREAGIAGEILAWRDVLHEGPVDASLSLQALSKRRARFIAERGWAGLSQASGGFAERDRLIQNAGEFEEVVLWFEDDLYDQLQLIQLLDFFARQSATRKKLRLVVVDGYIPPLSPAKITEMDNARASVTPAQFGLAKKAWRAFGSAKPSSIAKLLVGDTSALPYLAAALKRQLQEFPSLLNGLSRSEHETLSAIDEGHSTPVAAFLDVANKQESIFLGDTIFYWYLERLSGKKNALVTWADGSAIVAPAPENSREFVKRELKLTPLGRDVLSGTKDWLALNTRRRWIGGVEIAPGETSWRWDEGQRIVVRAVGVASKSPKPTRKRTTRKSSTRKSSTRKSSTRKSSTRKKTSPPRSAKKRPPHKKR